MIAMTNHFCNQKMIAIIFPNHPFGRIQVYAILIWSVWKSAI